MAGMMSATIVWSSEKKNTLERMAATVKKGLLAGKFGLSVGGSTYRLAPISSHEWFVLSEHPVLMDLVQRRLQRRSRRSDLLLRESKEAKTRFW